jgi:tetraacyldisaccharide 4'-kinase
MSWQYTYDDLISGRRRGAVAALARAALAALAWPYGGAVRLRNLYYDRWPGACLRLPAPVISVGNLTVGGTGKTPLVAWLARWYLARGLPVTILSRGYGGRAGQPNDEALELARSVPQAAHVQHPDRRVAAQKALADQPRQILLLDDGFQHRRVARDLDIVLMDALQPWGYGRLLPRGRLREPAASLRRADVVSLSRSDLVTAQQREAVRREVAALAPHALWIELVHRPQAWISTEGRTLPLEALRGAAVAAFCGLGNPEGFWRTLASCGVCVVDQRAWPDHCPYGPAEQTALHHWATRTPATHLVCTQKDFVKLQQSEIAGKPLWALQIELDVVRGREELEKRLAALATSVELARPQPANRSCP